MAALVPTPALDIRTAIERFASNQVMPISRAHKKLSDWRRWHTIQPGHDPNFPRHLCGYTREYEDITGDESWDWRGYVCNRVPDALHQVVGQGVQRVELRFLNTIDRNMNQNRVDFVLFRIDGSGVRLHPSHTRDAHPVIANNPAVWFLENGDLPNEEVGPRWVPDAPRGLLDTFRVVSQHDRVSHMGAAAFLERQVLAADQNNWSPGTFTCDITDQRAFPWASYFAHLRNGCNVIEDGVAKVQVVWQGRPFHRPAFYVEMRNGKKYLHSPVARITWDEDAASTIFWEA